MKFLQNYLNTKEELQTASTGLSAGVRKNF